MKIADRTIGGGAPTFVVAEISCNHEGVEQRAHWLIDAAQQAGADAVKFQLYRPEDLTLDRADWRAPAPWSAYSLWELYTKAQTPAAWFPELFAHARERGLVPFASAFAPWAIAALEALDCPAYKVASLEIGELELIRMMAATGKPLILSTGRANGAAIDSAARCAQGLQADGSVGQAASGWALLHCLSAYPAPAQEANLRRLLVLRHYGQPVGLSDHSRRPLVAEMAVTLGASIIEAHLMLPKPPREAPLDEGHSLEPSEFKEMVEGVRLAELMLGTDPTFPAPSERQTDACARRWIWRAPYEKGETPGPDAYQRLRGPEGLTEAPPLNRPLIHAVDAFEPVRQEDFG